MEYDLSYVDEKNPPFDETFVICYNNEPCGRIGLYDYDGEKSEIYLYYWVANPYRKKHIAMESILAVLNYLKNLGIKVVLLDVKKTNAQSIAFIHRLPNTTVKTEEDDYMIYECGL